MAQGVKGTGKKRGRGRPKGRPRVISTEIQNQLVPLLTEGNYLETAAGCIGLPMSNVRRWMRRGRQEHQRMIRLGKVKPRASRAIFVDFWLAVKKAVSMSEVVDLRIIRNASVKNWCAAAWRLERKNPKRWGRKDRVEATGKDGGPIQVQQTESLYDLAKRVAAKRDAAAAAALSTPGK